jgi:hypothetical protein
MVLRFDQREQITGFPSKVISPAPGMAVNGGCTISSPRSGLGWAI